MAGDGATIVNAPVGDVKDDSSSEVVPARVAFIE